MISEEERKCHQVFRLGKDGKEESYEWYKNRVEDRLEGTCQWFLTQSKFQSWLEQDSGVLLVSADPGCGKSVLAKYLVDEVLPGQDTVCYFFFKDQLQNTLKQALCALLHQLFSFNPLLIRYATPAYSSNGQELVNITSALWDILLMASRDPQAGSLVFVLDALDECSESDLEDLVRMIRNIFLDKKREHAGVKFLLTSRPYEKIVSEFHELTDDFPCLRIPGEEESESISKEINSVIAHRVKKLAREKRLASSIEMHLEQRLLEIKHRTYLWVYLVFDHLKSQTFKKTVKGMQSLLDTLPETVNDAYEGTLSKSKAPDMARKALCIILAAESPLTLRDMNTAINIESTFSSSTDLDLEDDEDFKDTLRNWCGLFISIYQGRVHLLHQTAREFLIAESAKSPKPGACHSGWQGSVSMPVAHSLIAQICIQYIGFRDFESTSWCDKQPERYQPFFEYSTYNWTWHFQQADSYNDLDTVSTAIKICDPEGRNLATWLRLYWIANKGYEPRRPTSLTVACYFGLVQLVKVLISEESLACTDEQGRTPLWWASRGGDFDVVELLLEKGAQVNVCDADGSMPLHIAAAKDHSVVIEKLCHYGADVNARSKGGWTPLHWAVNRGERTETAKILLDAGTDVNATDVDQETPLHLAVKDEDIEMIDVLAERGADLETKNAKGQTPLILALMRERCDCYVVERLLHRGARVNTQDSKGWTPLREAVNWNMINVVEVLLSHKADPNIPDDFGGTPLHAVVARGGHVRTGHPSDFDEQDQHFYHHRSRGGRPNVTTTSTGGVLFMVRLLLEKGADVNFRDHEGKTPLAVVYRKAGIATRSSYFHAVVEILRAHGAEE